MKITNIFDFQSRIRQHKMEDEKITIEKVCELEHLLGVPMINTYDIGSKEFQWYADKLKSLMENDK